MVKENSETLFQKNFSEVVKRGRKHITFIILILTTYTVLSHMIRTSNDLDTNEKEKKTPDLVNIALNDNLKDQAFYYY